MKRNMSIGMSICASAALLTGLVTAAGPATAAGAAAKCTPKLQVLGSLKPLTQASMPSEGVRALGKGNLSVGASVGKPAYWTGTTVHAVPLPGAQDTGELLGVAGDGLMLGRLIESGDPTYSHLFTYRAGDKAITRLPDGKNWDSGVGINDAGVIVGGRRGTPLVRMWQAGAVLRDLTVPQEEGPGSFIEHVGGINARGDVVATVDQDYEREDGTRTVRSFPVLWPGDGSPAKILAAVPYSGGLRYSWVEGIASDGRVVGSDWYGPGYDWKPWVWNPPHTEPGSSPGLLRTHPYASFEGISPTTNVTVGVARFHPDSPTLPDQAVLWKGSGDVLALPRLAANKETSAAAVSDDDRVGGAAVNASGKTRAVVWTCASKQAYLPQ